MPKFKKEMVILGDYESLKMYATYIDEHGKGKAIYSEQLNLTVPCIYVKATNKFAKDLSFEFGLEKTKFKPYI